MSFFSISSPSVFLTIRAVSAQATKIEARKGAVKPPLRAHRRKRHVFPEEVIGSMSRPIGKGIVFVDDGILVAVILGGRHDADLSIHLEGEGAEVAGAANPLQVDRPRTGLD